MQFYTRFFLPPYNVRILSQEDKVDRLSYVDSTTLVKRFIAEGRSLAMSRAHALYGNYTDAIEDSTPALSTYPEDPAIVSARLDSMTSELSSRIKKRSAKKTADNSEVTKAEDNQVPSDSEGAAVVSES